MSAIVQAAAFGIIALFMLGASQALAQSGPFGINPGDEMPSIADYDAEHDKAFELPSVSVEPPRDYDAMWLYGTDNIGICALQARTDFDAFVMEDMHYALSDKYGEMFRNDEDTSSLPYIHKGDGAAFHWRPSGGDVAKIVVVPSFDRIRIYYTFINFDECIYDYRQGGL